MNSVSTKTGDKGDSGLANGQRFPKNDLIFEVLGTQDEVNSWLGLAIAKLPEYFTEQKKFLTQVQDSLFYIGAQLARAPKAKLKPERLTTLEKNSENLQKKMVKNWTTKFLYPGGNEAAAILDVARTVARRFERIVVHYAQNESVDPLILKYVNRLSDYLYVLRCFVNHEERYNEIRFEPKDSYKKEVFGKTK